MTATMKRLSIALASALLGAALLVPSAQAAFGIANFDGEATADQLGSPFTQAGGHPYGASTTIALNQRLDALEFPVPDEYVREIEVLLPVGFVANPLASPVRCTVAELGGGSESGPGLCPLGSQVGTTAVDLGAVGVQYFPVFNMVPGPGEPAQLGFRFFKTLIQIRTAVREVDGEYRVLALLHNVSNTLSFLGSTVTLWGTPADPSHDALRGDCLDNFTGESLGKCPLDAAETPFVTMPGLCTPFEVGLESSTEMESWLGSKASASYFTHLPPGAPMPGPQQGPTGCGLVPFTPVASAAPTTREAEAPTGLRFNLDVPAGGLLSKEGIAQSAIRKAVVTLPEGVTINPSQAEGLGVCTPAQYVSTELSFFATPSKGCPSSSKIGTVEVRSPLLEETIEGDVFVAQQDDPSTPQQGAENPFDSLLAIYVVLENPERGILVKLAGKVEPDAATGRIVTTFDNLPQLPFSSFEFKFREGARAPLVTPPRCGGYSTEADFTPWSAIDANNPAEVRHRTSSFEMTSGAGGAPCPVGGVPDFKPGFTGGSINNNAKSYSPFYMRLTRRDGEQDMTRFSSVLPPGVLGKLAGIDKCPEAAIAAAAAKTGRQELAAPSCPANSQIGRISAGAGVGSVLTYVGGKVYLGGPYGGDPLSAVVVTPAVAGPFDVGTVVTREALTVNPDTAEVEVDGAHSDPIPHILKGIPLKLRDLRVHVDRDSFIVNPTSCDPMQMRATLFGSGLDVFSPADDVPVALSSRYQAANCASLGFKPRLALSLTGGTGRNGHPALRAVLNARPGDANIGAATVTLPRSAFLDQAHIRTICTRVQFAADACPKGAQYGYATAFTPLLDEPIQGPVYLRSSDNKLPDLVAALRGVVDVNVVGRIDSVNGGIRSSFETVPDAPVSKFILRMQGGKKGLIVNSRDLCSADYRATARFSGQNGAAHDFRPLVKPSCAKQRKHERQHRRVG